MQEDDRHIEALRNLAFELHERTGADALYIFWSQGAGDSSPRDSERRPRTLVAFPNADGALAFAQRNRMALPGSPARVRRLTLLQLLQVLVREPTIAALLIAQTEDEPPPPGLLPSGMLLAREAVIARLGPV
jgi:hypothetical protein